MQIFQNIENFLSAILFIAIGSLLYTLFFYRHKIMSKFIQFIINNFVYFFPEKKCWYRVSIIFYSKYISPPLSIFGLFSGISFQTMYSFNTMAMLIKSTKEKIDIDFSILSKVKTIKKDGEKFILFDSNGNQIEQSVSDSLIELFYNLKKSEQLKKNGLSEKKEQNAIQH